MNIEVKINKSRRKPIIMVYYHNRILIEFPSQEEATKERIDSIIADNKEWIETQVKKNLTSTLEIQEKSYDFVSGTLVFIKGEQYRLKVVQVKKDIEEATLIEGKELICRVLKKDAKYIRAAIKNFLYPKIEALIKEKVATWAKKIGVDYDKVFLKEYKTSWAHVRDNDLYFDWRIVFLEEKIINYLVIHEVLHFIHRNHGDEFMTKLKVLVPNYIDRDKELKELRYIIYRF